MRENKTIETDVDKLYDIVELKGMINIADAAKKLRVSPEQVEEWGRILEEHKLIRMHYPPVGEPVLILRKTKTAKKINKPGKKSLFIILISLILLICVFQLRNIKVKLTYNQFYLLISSIIIIVCIVIVVFVRRKMKKREGGIHTKK